MKIRITISALLLAGCSLCHGQAVPAGDSSMSSTLGPNLPTLDGVVHYSLSASEVFQFGYYGSGTTTHATDLTGNLAYTSRSLALPFSALFSGGVVLGDQQGQGNTSFWNASVSQGYVTRQWIFNVTDSFSFLPQSPETGLSGIPGVGDLGAAPVLGPTSGPAGGVLTTSGDRISNSLSGSVERQLVPNTSLSGTGSWGVLHYLGNPGVESESAENGLAEGLDSTSISGTVALNHRLDARSSVSLDAMYSTYSYSGIESGPQEPNFQTRGLNLSYQRVLSRTLSVNASVGPQWVSSSNSALIPSALNVAINAGVSYGYRNTHAFVGYTRGANGGGGVFPGARSDSISGSVGRSFGRDWVGSLNGAYTHTTGLTVFESGSSTVPTNDSYHTTYGGAQVTRRFSPHFSGYASYTVQNQSNNGLTNVVVQNVLSGASQTLGFGVTFAPRSTSLGQF
ncbi:hypothetical protein [Granulicella sp. S190]|uniref:hypothetical protein n=1 Tax=Granulicella sp. S190 TaxID=1747226 RepID=UPI00131E11FB|nr:hypothetical protein [Granulicella sp. S190]